MTMTRDIVIDLLPLYVAGEASADTRAAVERYLEQDASIRPLLDALQGHDDMTPPSPEVEQAAVNRARRLIAQRSWIFALALLCSLLPLAFAFRGGRITFLMLRDAPQSIWLWAAAAAFWAVYARLAMRLKGAGLS